MTGQVNEVAALTKLIIELSCKHLEVADITNPYDLFRLDGFDKLVDELGPTLAQVNFALQQAKAYLVEHKSNCAESVETWINAESKDWF